jgi:hypothetical protein
MNCDFVISDGAATCQRCGKRLDAVAGVPTSRYRAQCAKPAGRRDPASRAKSSRPTLLPSHCPHLGPPAGESTTVFGVGCKSDQVNGVSVSVWQCELHGRCVVAPRVLRVADESIVACEGCIVGRKTRH